MKKIPVTNNTMTPIYIGSAMVPPGETREFDENDVPPHLKPKAVEQVAHQRVDVVAFLAESAPDILASIGNLSDDQLQSARATEAKLENPRQNVLAGLQAELEKRGVKAEDPADAVLKELAGKAAKEVIALLEGLGDEDLGKLEKLEQGRMDGEKPSARKTVLEAISEEMLKRAGGSAG